MKSYLILLSLVFFQFSFAQETTNESIKTWSLENLINYALENNITIKSAHLSKELAKVDYDKAKSSRLPNLFGSASQSFTNGNSIDPITSNFVTDQINSSNVGLNTTMTLFQGNQLNNQVKQNKMFFEQSILQEEVEKNNIVLNLLETYLQALYNKESITIAENNLASSENEVVRAKSRLDAGTIAISEYTEAQSQAATNKYNLIAAKNNYLQYIVTLKTVIRITINRKFRN